MPFIVLTVFLFIFKKWFCRLDCSLEKISSLNVSFYVLVQYYNNYNTCKVFLSEYFYIILLN